MIEYKEGEDYSLLIPEGEGESIDVKVLSGVFTGVIYNYGKVKVEENEEDGSAHLAFEYDVIDSNGFENLEETAEFKNYIGDVLVSMIMKNIPADE
jgi:hypothetical protein